MSESKRKIEFQYKKRLFELIAEDFTCNSCQMVPRNGPIFQSLTDRKNLCSNCKKPTHENFHEFFGFDKLLKELPNFCKYKKNDCKVVLEPENLDYHEEECEYRDVICPLGFCQENIPANEAQNHLKSAHDDPAKDATSFDDVKMLAKIQVNEDELDQDKAWGAFVKNDNNLFLLQARLDASQKLLIIWFQLFGTKFETKNYECIIKVGNAILENHLPHSLDDDKQMIYQSKDGLIVPILKKNIQDNAMTIECKIKDMKSEVEVKKQKLEEKEIILQNLGPKVYCREDFSSVNRFEEVYKNGWAYSRDVNDVDAIQFMTDTDVIIGGFGLYGNPKGYIGKIKLFDIGTGHENNAILLAESELITYQCEARNTFPILFKDPLKIKAQRWYILVLFEIMHNYLTTYHVFKLS